jgi:hypothetical protein
LQSDNTVELQGVTRRLRELPGPLRWIAIALFTVLAVAACRAGVPVIDTAPGPAVADGTISGTVRGPEGSAVEGRQVEVTDVDTGQTERVLTSTSGGFTVKVKPGKYRVTLALREGETIVRQPGVISVNRSDVDAHADFVLGTVRVARPRGPAYRVDDGLGSPVA